MSERLQNEALNVARESKAIFQKIRLPLDEGLKRSQGSFSGFNKPFKGLWVNDVSDSSIEVNVRFNSKHDSGSTIALRRNMVINHDKQVIDAIFTAPPQAGQWIEVTFGIESSIDIGNIEQIVTGSVDLTPVTVGQLNLEVNKSYKNVIEILNRKYELSQLKENPNLFHGKLSLQMAIGLPINTHRLNVDVFDFPSFILNRLETQVKHYQDNTLPFRMKLKAIGARTVLGHTDMNFFLQRIERPDHASKVTTHQILIYDKQALNFDNFEYPEIPYVDFVHDILEDEIFQISIARIQNSNATLDTIIDFEYIIEIEEL